MSTDIKAVDWVEGKVRIIDQTRLPHEEVYCEISNYRDVASAIKELRVRGAPAIGIAAAYGLALGAQEIKPTSKKDFLKKLYSISKELASTRPTAVNLTWALKRMERAAAAGENIDQIKRILISEAQAIDVEDEKTERALSRHGAALIGKGYRILTHCNTGALAAGYGTALGVIRSAWQQGKKLHVYVGETRPLLQGARLTAWELKKYGIPFTLITDTMSGYFLARGDIDCAIVGADRIAANGDVANKIGTYNIAVLATENAVPFYVAAPTSSIDLSLASGDKIPIEARSAEEVTHIRGVPIDITPHRYVSAIITEYGVATEPYTERLSKLRK
jgi:methylthioribose-1-phosphate isomerase